MSLPRTRPLSRPTFAQHFGRFRAGPLVVALACLAGSVRAQDKVPAPDPVPAVGPDVAPAAGPDAGPDAGPTPLAKPRKPVRRNVLAEALAIEPGGLRLADINRRAAIASPNAAVAHAEMEAAAARVDQALAAYFPKATLTAAYTRLSRVENKIDTGIPGVEVPSFPVILNSYSLVASLQVPFSDYLLRLTQAYATVSLDVDAKKLEVRANQLQAAADAQVAYFNWLRARGQKAVAELAVAQAEAHFADAEIALSAGAIAKVELIRLQAQISEARQLVVAASGFEHVAAEQVRIMLAMKDGEAVRIGIDVFSGPPSLDQRPLKQLQSVALDQRLDLKALRLARKSLKEVESVKAAALYPRVDGFANLTYANPNQRIFPQSEKWDLTWDLGVRMTWTINDTFQALGATAETRAQVAVLDQRARALTNGVRMSVASAYFDARTANQAIETAKLRTEASEQVEAARRKMLRAGAATATDMVDAQTELTRSRLGEVNATIDAFVAKAKLDLAIGKDLRSVPVQVKAKTTGALKPLRLPKKGTAKRRRRSRRRF